MFEALGEDPDGLLRCLGAQQVQRMFSVSSENFFQCALVSLVRHCLHQAIAPESFQPVIFHMVKLWKLFMQIFLIARLQFLMQIGNKTRFLVELNAHR
jgi:hypothetical protein